MNEPVYFGSLRKLISVTDRISMCMRESGDYENFETIREVPDKYDAMIVKGVGLTSMKYTPTQKEIESGYSTCYTDYLEIVLLEEKD